MAWANPWKVLSTEPDKNILSILAAIDPYGFKIFKTIYHLRFLVTTPIWNVILILERLRIKEGN